MRLDVRRVDVRAFPKIRGRGPAGMVKGVLRWVLGRRGVAVTAPVLVFEAQRRATRER